MNKSYYAVIPADVRYSNIPANAKLLYGEITALCNEKGYCWATNGYFAKLYKVKNETISRWASALQKQGFIRIEPNKSKGFERRIFLSTYSQKSQGLLTKRSIAIDKKVKHNNTVNTTSNTPTEYGKPSINELISFLEDKVLMDGTKTQNRNYCNNLIKKMVKEFPARNSVELIKHVIELGLEDEFHSKNITGFKYIYYNISKLMNLGKEVVKPKEKKQVMKGNYLESFK